MDVKDSLAEFAWYWMIGMVVILLVYFGYLLAVSLGVTLEDVYRLIFEVLLLLVVPAYIGYVVVNYLTSLGRDEE